MTSTLTTIISIIVTIFIGIPAFISLRYQLKSKIFFFTNQKLKLYDDVIKNIPELSITYEGNKIKKNMFLLNGIFIFSGKKDITKDSIQKGIIIKIKDDDSNWLTHKIINKTDNLDIRTSQIKSSLNIDFDLLTDKDYFILEALGESDSLNISYSHRIANVSKIQTGEIGVFKDAKMLLLIIFIFVLTFWISLWKTKPFEVWESDLKATYYDNSGDTIQKEKIIPESKTIIETTNIDSTVLNDSISPILKDLKSELQKRRVENNKRNLYLNLTIKLDSLKNIASTEYSRIGLMIIGQTKPYIIDKNNFVKYKLIKGSWSLAFIFSLFLILLSLALTIEFIGMIIHYFKYKRISKLALRLLKQYG